jgi:hypothetical protein
MTRQLPEDSVTDIVTDGLTEDEIATRFETWLSDLQSFPTVKLPFNAVDELRHAYADGDV